MKPNRFRTLVTAFCALLVAACNAPAEQEGEEQLVVLAAASLQEALTEASDEWATAGHAAPALSFAGSSALARQVESGAKADIFISADEEWMDELERKGLIRKDSRQDLLGNALVLIAPKGSAPVALDQTGSLRAAMGDGRLAMADPDAVPAGRYGKAALENLGQWNGVSAQLAPAENVRAALALVERGQAPLGIVYATDAQASDKVEVVATFPASSHPTIRYPAAVIATSTNSAAAPFLDFLKSAEARRIFEARGFTAPE